MTGRRRQGSGEPKTSERNVSAALKQAEAIKLRICGKTFEEIAVELGYSGKQGAYKAVVSGLNRTLQEPAAELRKLEIERLDSMTKAIWGKVEGGDNGAIVTALRIAERRAKLLGLDAPTKVGLEPLVREMAAAEGLEAAEVLEEVQRLLHAQS